MGALARADAAGATGPREALVRAVKEDARAAALNVAPVLAHLNPMPGAVWVALLNKINDPDEPQAAALIIEKLSQNNSLARAELVRQLVTKAIDERAPTPVRVAAIYAIGRLDASPAVLSELARLSDHSDEKIADAARRIGVGAVR